uniref:Uncharacterized protein n=1 Tax=Daphnia galeata TaxID=27404 RepID=A0A8J2WD43_9CRUS|nr:unnamed protein product [Daphnia galeata]
MSVFELSLWMDPCNEKSLADCNSDMSFVVASTLQELISEAQTEFNLTGPCQIVNLRGTIVKSDKILFKLQSDGVRLFVKETSVVSTGTAGVAWSSEEVGVAQKGDGTGVARSSEEVGVAQSGDGTGVARSSEEVGVAQIGDGTGVARSSEEVGVAQSGDGTGVARSSEEVGVAQSGDGTGVARSSEEVGVAQSGDGTGVARSSEEVGVAQIGDGTGVARNSEEVGVTEDDGHNKELMELDDGTDQRLVMDERMEDDEDNDPTMGALNNPESVNDEVEEEASIDTDIDSDENGDIVDLNGNTDKYYPLQTIIINMRKGIRGMKGGVLMETIQKENRPSATHTRLLMNAAGRWLMLNCKEKEKFPSPAEFTKMAESIRHFFPNTGNSKIFYDPATKTGTLERYVRQKRSREKKHRATNNPLPRLIGIKIFSETEVKEAEIYMRENAVLEEFEAVTGKRLDLIVKTWDAIEDLIVEEAERYPNSLKLEVSTNRINLIKFIRLMHAEAKQIDWKAKLLTQDQQLQSLTKDSTTFNAQLQIVWTQYNHCELSSKELLLALSSLSRKH